MNVAFENVIQILEVAHRFQAIDMKKYALNLVVHHFPKVSCPRYLNKIPSVIPSGYFFLCNNGEL